MKRSCFPLSLKFLGWLAVNLAVLVLPFTLVLGAAVGWRWEWVERTLLGDRMRSLADTTLVELRDADEKDRNSILERRSTETNLPIALYDFEGKHVAGPDLQLPEELLQRLKAPGKPMPFMSPGSVAPPPNNQPPPQMGPQPNQRMLPPPEGEPGPDHGPGPDGPEPEAFRKRPEFHRSFIHFGGHPAPCWIVLRSMLHHGSDKPPEPANLVILVPSFWRFLIVFNIWILFCAGAVAFAISALLWLPMLRGITRSIGEIGDATRLFAEGRFDTRIRQVRRDELGLLANDINSMAARLEVLVSAQRRFLGDAAHELGSPLARLQVSTAILEENPKAISEEMIADIREEVQIMSRLVEELLAFSRLQTAPAPPTLGAVELLPLWESVVEREDVAQTITWEVEPGLSVVSNEGLLDRVLSNLVRNCLRYAPGTKTHLRAWRDAGKVLVELRDEGPGVPAGALKRLGEPFFRPDLARTREAGGHGLGLAIVRSAAASIGATVEFTANVPTGLVVTLTLPESK